MKLSCEVNTQLKRLLNQTYSGRCVKLRYPILIINFKTYIEATGRRALELAKTAEKIAKEYDVSIAVAPQHVDLRLVAENVEIPVLAQSADPEPPGAHTGHISLEAIKEAGAIGVILNHSEKRVRIDQAREIIERCRKLDLTVVACAAVPIEAAAIAILGPEAVAIEPPELIGTGRAVSREKPEVVTNGVNMVKKVAPQVHVLCGAGVESGEDVRRALELGAEGVLVASAIVKAKDWNEKIREMARELRTS